MLSLYNKKEQTFLKFYVEIVKQLIENERQSKTLLTPIKSTRFGRGMRSGFMFNLYIPNSFCVIFSILRKLDIKKSTRVFSRVLKNYRRASVICFQTEPFASSPCSMRAIAIFTCSFTSNSGSFSAS